MVTAADESMFFEMSGEHYSRPAQIPISMKRFKSLTDSPPTEEGDWIIFSHPGHFMVYNKITGYCIFDATYVLLSEIDDEQSAKDAIVAVVTEIVINQNNAQRPSLNRNEFTILANLIGGRANESL